MNRVQRPHRLAGKGLSRTLDDLGTNPQHVPVRRRSHEMCSPVSRLAFLQLAERDRTKKHTVALDQREVGGDDDLSGRQYFSDLGT